MADTPNTKVVTGKVRFSYAHVFEPASVEDEGEKKYSVCLLINKKDKTTLAAIKKAIEAAKEAGKATLGGKIPANLKQPLRDGDAEKADEKPEYAGCYFLNCSSKTKPGVVDENLNKIIDKDEFYSGCFGRASLNFYAFNTKGNKGVAAGLNNLQKLEDGERLGGFSSPEDDFGGGTENEDDDDLF